MSLQKRAFRIVRDVIGIVLDWNDRHLSDKEAMKEITRSLLIHKENGNGKKIDGINDIDSTQENPRDILELEANKEEIIEVKKEEAKIKEKEQKVKIKKNKKLFQNFRAEKKIIAPIIISGFFILVVGIVNPYEIASNLEIGQTTQDKSVQFKEIPSDNDASIKEQFLEIPSDTIEKIQNGTKVTLEP